MSLKIEGEDGREIEVYTAAEVQEQLKAKETEFTTVKTTLQTELDETKKALGTRAGEFAKFRKLNDDTIAKLGVAERQIYENSLALEEARVARETAEKRIIESQVDSAIRIKAGNDEKLIAKMKDMWSIIGIDAVTPEMIENKAKMILGAISTTEPNLLASVGFGGGSWNPPQEKKEEDKSFADTPQGQAGAAELGLKLK